MTMSYRVKRCDCCDLPVESCGKAAEQRERAEIKAERERLLQIPGVIPAKFPGKCASCGNRFDAGTPIIAHLHNGWRSLGCCERGQ